MKYYLFIEDASIYESDNLRKIYKELEESFSIEELAGAIETGCATLIYGKKLELKFRRPKLEEMVQIEHHIS